MAKVSRLCQLSSHSRGFFLCCIILNLKGLTYGFLLGGGVFVYLFTFVHILLVSLVNFFHIFSEVLRRESCHVACLSPPPMGEHSHKTPTYDTKMQKFVISISGKAMVKWGGVEWASKTEAEKRLNRRPQAGGK
jgi:hypothetical protein